MQTQQTGQIQPSLQPLQAGSPGVKPARRRRPKRTPQPSGKKREECLKIRVHHSDKTLGREPQYTHEVWREAKSVQLATIFISAMNYLSFLFHKPLF